MLIRKAELVLENERLKQQVPDQSYFGSPTTQLSLNSAPLEAFRSNPSPGVVHTLRGISEPRRSENLGPERLASSTSIDPNGPQTAPDALSIDGIGRHRIEGCFTL
jgi:hypothetical protein